MPIAGSDTVLSGLIQAEMLKAFPNGIDADYSKKFADAVAKAVVDWIATSGLQAVDLSKAQLMIPTGAVIIAVGGSAVGTSNPAPIPIQFSTGDVV